MSKPLKGKVALVTGASRGIGAAIARRLSDDGADVAVSYAASADKANALVAELEKKGVRAAAFKADQGSAPEVKALVKSVVAHFGHLDILVNNAGVFVPAALDGSENGAAASRQFAVNVEGVATAVAAAAPSLPEGGRIISIGSVLGARTPWAGLAAYSATKAALGGYTRGWARDFGPKAITVNLIQPGPINTDMNPDNGDFATTQKAGTALGRYGKPEEVAAAVAFLASPEAAYITGASLDVDGGFGA